MTLPAYRGIYVDNFKHDILPDPAKQTALLKWAKQNYFNTLSLYLDDILDSGAASPTRAALSAFISNARTAYGITGVTAVESRDYMLVPSAAHPDLEYLTVPHYNSQRTAASQKIDAVQLELDWWLQPETTGFAGYSAELSIVAAQAQANHLTNEAYFARCNSSTGKELQQATTLLQKTSRILLVESSTTPSYNYLQVFNQLHYLGLAAGNLGKKANIILLFYCSPSTMFNYFQTNPFSKTYDDVIALYNAQVAGGHVPNEIKNNITFSGYQIFMYHDALAAKPLLLV